MKQELFQRAKEEYQNAILFFQAGKRNDFYRYLGTGEAFERMLRENYELSDAEDKELCALTDICDEYEDGDVHEITIRVLPKEICAEIAKLTDSIVHREFRHDGLYYLPSDVFNREFKVKRMDKWSFLVEDNKYDWAIPIFFCEWVHETNGRQTR